MALRGYFGVGAGGVRWGLEVISVARWGLEGLRWV
jgi:hypothetical protein